MSSGDGLFGVFEDLQLRLQGGEALSSEERFLHVVLALLVEIELFNPLKDKPPECSPGDWLTAHVASRRVLASGRRCGSVGGPPERQ